MGNLFDDITRIVGSSMPRRNALRFIASALAGGVLNAFGFPVSASQCVNCPSPNGGCCTSLDKCLSTSNGCCTSGVACPSPNGFCCPSVASCLPVSGCCTSGELCPRGPNNSVFCCAPVDRCNPRTGTCCPERTFYCPGPGNTSFCCDAGVRCNSGVGCCPRPSTFTIAGYYADHIDILVQNDDSGLTSITIAEAINCTVSIPKFDRGTTAPVEVTATKIDLNSRSRIVLEACPTDCGCECCDEGDPVLTHLEIPAQESSETIQKVKETFTEIPQKESYISVQNGARGLKRLRIKVNGKSFDTLHLKDGKEKLVNVASMMEEGENQITLIGYGKAGAKALILISDIAVNSSGKSSDDEARLQRRLFLQETQHQPGQNLTWGR